MDKDKPDFEKVTAAVLAGGKSSRMKSDKAMLPINNQSMLEHILSQLQPHFGEVLICTNSAGRYHFEGVRVVLDFVEGLGPLAGILAALEAARNPVVFVTACDIPMINLELVGEMCARWRQFDCVVPTLADGLYEPLFALYQKRLLPAIKAMLARGERSVMKLFAEVDVTYIRVRESAWYKNLNTMQDFREYKKELNEPF